MTIFPENTQKYEYNMDKALGCIVGGAVGDALGYPVEFRRSIHEIQKEYGPNGITRFRLSEDGTAHFSDDTQMTLFTASGLMQAGSELNLRGFGDERSWQYHIGSHYIDWFWTQNGKPYKKHASWLFEIPELHSRRGPGITCLTSLQDMVNGTDPDNDSKGCGGIMRVAPIALCADLRERMPADFVYMLAGKSAYITHNAPLGFIPAAFMVMLLDKIMHSECEINGLSLEKMVLDCMKEIRIVRLDYDASQGTYSQFAKDIEELERLVEMAVTLAKEGGRDVDNIERLGGGWTGETALVIALYCAMKHSDSFEEAVVAAVNHSGDSDSTGAICGNIMGLIYGYEAIPAHFKEHLELLPVLKEVAADLYTGSMKTDDKAVWKKKYLDGHRAVRK